MKNSYKIFLKRYKKYLKELHFFINKLFIISSKKDDGEIGEIFKIAYQTITSGGKFLRSLITLISCEIICGDFKPALPIAVAYELGHNATLIQDDLIDNSPKRRGIPTIHTRYGLSSAVLTSDILIFQIFNLVARYNSFKNISKSQICALLQIIGKCATETAIGEYLDEKYTNKINLPFQKYYKLIEYKTGKLFAGPLACGAIVGGASQREVNLMYEIGEKIGIAFQIQDDLLDVIGEPSTLKKPIFLDIRNGKPNLVILHAFKKAPFNQKKFIKKIFGKKEISPNEFKKIMKILLNTNSILFAKKTCKKWKKEAEEILIKKIKTKNYSAKEKLIDIINFITERNI